MTFMDEKSPTRDVFYTKPLVPDVHVVKSRLQKSGIFDSEYISAFGIDYDNPKDKYFKTCELPTKHTKPFSDYLNHAKGTTKFSIYQQGYSGNKLF